MKKFSKVKMVKELSRDNIGVVPVTKIVPHKNKRKYKHPKEELEKEKNEI
jgi:hypothetical protein